MTVEISGARCISCANFTQYYDSGARAINHGFCEQRQCITRPGSRCRHYRERSNVGVICAKKEINTCR